MLCMSYLVAVIIVSICAAIGALIVPPAAKTLDKKNPNKARNQKILFTVVGFIVGIAIVFFICMARKQ